MSYTSIIKRVICLCLITFVTVIGLSCDFKKRGSAHRSKDDQKILEAFRNRQSDLVVEASGTVINILSDDLKGSRHQRFIIQLDHGQTLLVSHNIDIASRIVGLRVGDRIHFRGEYEWNSKGGVLHWTHRDPLGRRQGGWIEHNEKRYF